MHVLLAPDSFSGTLTAAAAAEAMADGWRQVRPDDQITMLPMSDGGEGLLDVVAGAVAGAQRRTAEVADARGHACQAQWLLLPDGRAVIESAQACGLSSLPPDLRNPRLTTTYGVGQLIEEATDAGARQILVGLGGSATVDGGAGAATALGHRLLRADGNRVKVGGEFLTALETIAPAPPVPAAIVALADVDAPLLGYDGAVAGFAAQKGAGPQDLELLEQALTRLADVAERDLPGGPWRAQPGSGAAGGLGFGLAAFTGATISGGAEFVRRLVGLDDAVAAADFVVTGEGRLDDWSLRWKVCGTVAAAARAHGRPVHAVAGAVTGGRGAFDGAIRIGPDGLTDPHGTLATAAGMLAKVAGRSRPGGGVPGTLRG